MCGLAARARTRSARLTIPTMRPSRTTGTRFMRCVVRSSAICFEAEVKKYVETFSKEGEQQKATFQTMAAAQLNAWQDASDKVHAAAAGFAAERRADINAAVKQMKADASEAEATFQNLTRAGTASWTALTGALAQSRAAFDAALQAAADALKRAGQSGGVGQTKR